MTRPPGFEDIIVTRWAARFMGRHFPCAVGRGGIRPDKREGDGASPAGAWDIRAAYYRADRRAPPRLRHRPLIAVGPRDIWIDASGDARYNRPAVALWEPVSHERLARADRLYDFVITTSHNAGSPVPGAGSAIFIHGWRRPRFPTAGCLAVDPRALDWIAARLTPRSRLIFR